MKQLVSRVSAICILLYMPSLVDSGPNRRNGDALKARCPSHSTGRSFLSYTFVQVNVDWMPQISVEAKTTLRPAATHPASLEDACHRVSSTGSFVSEY